VILSVVSGKGGAGKTTIATSLAQILSADYYDLDVDAPNGEYFLAPDFDSSQPVYVLQPEIDSTICTGCGDCARECRFKALYTLLGQTYLNSQLCHSCKLCREVCPAKAISYRQESIGEIRCGFSSRTTGKVIIGDLQIGSTRETALIQEITALIDRSRMVVIDGPPGNSCAAVAAICPADLVVLVVEPTPFGIHDMLQTLDILQQMEKPLVVVANKTIDSAELEKVLADHQLAIAASIPLQSSYHKALLQGEILSRAEPAVFRQLKQALKPRVATL